MPQKKKKKAKQKQQEAEDTFTIRVSKHGPLPHPSLLEQYNQLAPDAVDRILKMADEEARHRRARESAELNARIERQEWRAMERRLGQIFGLLITLSALGIASWLGIKGREIAAAAIGASALVFPILASWIGSQKDEKGQDSDQESVEK